MTRCRQRGSGTASTKRGGGTCATPKRRPSVAAAQPPHPPQRRPPGGGSGAWAARKARSERLQSRDDGKRAHGNVCVCVCVRLAQNLSWRTAYSKQVLLCLALACRCESPWHSSARERTIFAGKLEAREAVATEPDVHQGAPRERAGLRRSLVLHQLRLGRGGLPTTATSK